MEHGLRFFRLLSERRLHWRFKPQAARNARYSPLFPPLSRTMASDKRSWQTPRTVIEQGNITLPKLYEWHAHHNSNYPLFRYSPNGCDVKEIDYAHIFRAICRASSYIRSHICEKERIPIAILANAGEQSFVVTGLVLTACMADTITYCCTSVGIMHAGHTAFHISPRNGPAAVVDLLQRTQCRFVLVSPDVRASTMMQDISRQLCGVNLLPLPQFCELFLPNSEEDQDEGPETWREDALESTALILHSSGRIPYTPTSRNH